MKKEKYIVLIKIQKSFILQILWIVKLNTQSSKRKIKAYAT